MTRNAIAPPFLTVNTHLLQDRFDDLRVLGVAREDAIAEPPGRGDRVDILPDEVRGIVLQPQAVTGYKLEDLFVQLRHGGEVFRGGIVFPPHVHIQSVKHRDVFLIHHLGQLLGLTVPCGAWYAAAERAHELAPQPVGKFNAADEPGVGVAAPGGIGIDMIHAPHALNGNDARARLA